jgi:hypothetical protein
MHAREIIFAKTLASILDQAGITADELRELRRHKGIARRGRRRLKEALERSNYAEAL